MSKRRSLLLVDDDNLVLATTSRGLQAAGYDTRTAQSVEDALELLADFTPDLALLDIRMGKQGGFELARVLRDRHAIPFVFLSAYDDADTVEEATELGAVGFLVKPVDETRLLDAVRNARAERRPRAGAPALAAPDPDLDHGPLTDTAGFIGSSEPMRRIHGTIASVARSMATVFITGESGTGKELCALAVHDNSNRSTGPFIALNCGAIPQDLLESEVFGHMKGSFTGAVSDKPGAAAAADGGTLFLDEVCEMAPALQTKLLRFLQTSTVQPVGATRPRKVNVRIVCATNRDPLDAVRRGQFREDLYYRLYVVPIHMPPLRERGNDVIEIAEAALSRFALEEGRHFAGLAPQVRSLFRSLPWPGNVRQVLNVIRNVVVLNEGDTSTQVTLDMLPPDLAASDGGAAAQLPLSPPTAKLDIDTLLGLTFAEIERKVIEATIAHHAGSIPKAARTLDVSPSTLYRKIESWVRP